MLNRCDIWQGGQKHGEDPGIPRTTADKIAYTGSLREEATRFVKVLSGRGEEVCPDFTCLNAGTMPYVAGRCDSIGRGARWPARHWKAAGRWPNCATG